jgi:hypothetical protein
LAWRKWLRQFEPLPKITAHIKVLPIHQFYLFIPETISKSNPTALV